jgi:DNA repair protein RadC
MALKVAASAIILAHNHPSGSLKTSRADIDLTRKISEASQWMDIKILDHIVLAQNELYLNLKEESLL